MSKKSLTLHPEHGLNPSVSLCYVCGRDKEIILFGKNMKEKAPRQAHYDKTPCEDCQKVLNNGIMLIEVKDGEQEKANNEPYRTGYIVGLSLKAGKNLFPDADLSKHRIFFIEESQLKIIMGESYRIEKKG